MFEKITEQPSLYDRLEEKSTREILEDINREDRKVAEAVSRTIPMIERLVEQIIPRMEQGGRLFYMGAGTSGCFGGPSHIRYAPQVRYRADRRRGSCPA